MRYFLLCIIIKAMKKRLSDIRFYGGKYYKRLFAVFTGSAVLFSAVVALFSFYIGLRVAENEKNAFKAFAQNRYNLIDTAAAVVTGVMDNFIKNPYLAEWADAENANAYYAKAVVLYGYIKNISSQLAPLSYELAVIGERYDTMTISGLGSGPRDWYVKYETSLSAEHFKSLSDAARNQDGTTVFPVYDDNTGILKELYFIRCLQWKTQITFVVLKLFADPVFIPAENENFCITLARGVSVYARSGENGNTMHANNKNYRSYSQALHIPSWNLTVEYRIGKTVRLLLATVPLVFSLCVFILCIYAASRTARRLYSPLGEIVRRFIPQNAGAVNDEFEILRTNSRKMELLSQELQKTIEENEALAVQKYNRGLLEGVVSEEDAKNTDVFFVASVILTAEEGTAERDRRPYVQLCAEACSIGEEGIHYVQYGIKEFALILDCADETEAKEKLKTFLAKLQLFSNSAFVGMQAALSGATQGKACLAEALKQVRDVLEFRHTRPHASILTACDVAFATAEHYDYPLATEKKLLDFVIAGSTQTAVCFDEIINENIRNKDLSFSARRNLLHALSATLMRALQELKTTSEQLYGKTEDWNALYTGQPDKTAFNEIKNIAVKIANAVRKKEFDADTKILQLMNDYICRNFQRDISLQDLSDEFNITPKYCSKLFARLSNNTFKNYLNALRIQKAQNIICENPLVKTVDLAGKVGFNSATSFIRVFNKYAGVSPQVYADRVLQNIAPQQEQ